MSLRFINKRHAIVASVLEVWFPWNKRWFHRCSKTPWWHLCRFIRHVLQNCNLVSI